MKEEKYNISKIMEISAEIAELKVTQELGGCAWITCENGDEMFTEEAQDLFNCEYDQIYNLLTENA